MKKIAFALFALLLFLGFSADAQLKPNFKDWFFYDVAVLQYLDAPAGMEQQWFSNGHYFSLMAQSQFGKHFALGYGLGFSSENFHNNMRIRTLEQSGDETYHTLPDTSFESNRQNLGYLWVPLELRFKGRANSKGQFFRFYLGAKLGLRVRSYHEFETQLVKQRYYNFEDLARLRGDAYLRIGFDNLSLFASYSFTELFTQGELIYATPNQIEQNSLRSIRPIALGVSISL